MRVFLCTLNNYHEFLPSGLARLRHAAFNLVHSRWELENVQVEVISPHSLGCSRHEFQRSRRIYAEERRGGTYFVVSDDDCLLPSPFYIQQCLDVMDKHPQYAILSLMYHGMGLQDWHGEETEDVLEHVSVGGIRFCRATKMFDDWPPSPISGGYDYIQAEALRAAGWRVGYLKSIPPMHHLAEGRLLTSAWA